MPIQQRSVAAGCPPAERLACLHATLAATSTAILRCRTPEAVYRAACNACINHAGFRLAWIGIADAGRARLLPVEAAGPACACLDGLVLSLDPTHPEGDSAAAQAHRQQAACLRMDLAGETRDPLRRRLQRAWGLASAVALPLRRGGEPYGTLAVYADSRFFFDDDALCLLQDLADTVSLALDLFDREAHRQSVEAALRASEARLQEAQALCQVGDWELDRDSGRMSWSPQLFRLFERPESAGVPDLDEATAWYTPASLELTRDRYRHAIETGERSTVEQEVHLPSGRIRHHSTVIVPVPDAAGRVYKLYGTVQDITERKELERERIAHLARVGELSRHLVEAQECERRRLASELHDSASPNLAALQLTVANLAAALPPAVKCAVAPLLDDIRGLLDDTTAAIRRISTELRPATLDYAGLAALREYAEQFARRSGIAVEFVDTAPATALPPTLQLVLFRVAQEALTNCAKHAAAGRIRIELAQADGTFRMSIIDDGVGFDPELLGRQEPAPGLGLITMKERAEFAGGRFAVHSEPGRGAEIRIEFDAPLQDGALSEEQA